MLRAGAPPAGGSAAPGKAGSGRPPINYFYIFLFV